MAAAPGQQGMAGVVSALQGIHAINMKGFAGIESSLRKEFGAQNKLLGGYIGKNIEKIATAITGASADLIKQMQDDARKMAEQMAEMQPKEKGGGQGDSAVDRSIEIDLSSLGGVGTAIAAMGVGFVSGFFGEFRKTFSNIGKDLKAFGKWMKGWFKAKAMAVWKPVGSWWRGSGLKKWYDAFKAFFVPTIDKEMSMRKHTKIMRESGIMKIYRSIKNWFGKKLFFWWRPAVKMVSESSIMQLYRNIKSWFSTKFTLGWTKIKDLWKGSKLFTWYTALKSWFQADIGKGGIFTKIKNLLGKSKFLTQIADDIKWFKGLFAGGGTGAFAQVKAFIGSLDIKLPSWIDDTIKSVKGVFNASSGFFGGLGRVLGKLFFWFQIIMAAFDFWTGWQETQGGIWDKLWGGLTGALKGFIGGFLDLGIMIEDGIKWIIAKIAGFFGFDEEAIAATMADFSLFGPLKDGLFAVVDWIQQLMTNPLAAFEGLFGGMASVGLWIYNNALKPVWDWFEGMFPDAAATIKPFFEGIATVGLWIYNNALKPAWDWIKGIFSFGDSDKGDNADSSIITTVMDAFGTAWKWIKGIFTWTPNWEGDEFDGFNSLVSGMFTKAWTWIKSIFTNPVEALKTALGAWASFQDMLLAPFKKAVAWILGIFGFEEASANVENFSFKTFITDAFDTVVAWIKGIFAWSSTEDEGDSWLVKTIKGAIELVKTWIGSLFKFDSTSAILATAFNVLTFLPNMVFKGITAVSSWLAGLFGFTEASKNIANAGKFSLGEMLFSAIESIWEWFKGLLDIDVMSIVKSIPGGETLMSLFGAGESSKAVKGLESLGIKQGTLDVGKWDIMDQEKQIRAAAKNMSQADFQKMAAQITAVGAAGDLDTDDMENVMSLLGELQAERDALARQGGSGVVIVQDNSSKTVNTRQESAVIVKAIEAKSDQSDSLSTGNV